MSGLLGAWQSEPLLQQPEDESCPQRPGPGPEPVHHYEAAVEGPFTSPVVAQMNGDIQPRQALKRTKRE